MLSFEIFIKCYQFSPRRLRLVDLGSIRFVQYPKFASRPPAKVISDRAGES